MSSGVGKLKGKPGIAPCGCPGQYVIGTYVQCLNGCDEIDDLDFSDLFDDQDDGDAMPRHIDPEKTKPLCRHCGSDNVQIYPGFTASGKDLYHCAGCLRSFVA